MLIRCFLLVTYSFPICYLTTLTVTLNCYLTRHLILPELLPSPIVSDGHVKYSLLVTYFLLVTYSFPHCYRHRSFLPRADGHVKYSVLVTYSLLVT